MKKKYIVLLIFIAILLVIGLVLFFNREVEYPDDENTLYSVKFDNAYLKVKRYDYALGQNQMVGVEKSTDKGKNYEFVTTEAVVVSMQPKFVFLNEKLGFAIAKPNLTKSNDYIGVMVTQDGGKTFRDGIINYDNPNIEVLTVLDVPYYDNNSLKLHCSIYQIKENQDGYENIDLIFESIDNGLTWNLE